MLTISSFLPVLALLSETVSFPLARVMLMTETSMPVGHRLVSWRGGLFHLPTDPG